MIIADLSDSSLKSELVHDSEKVLRRYSFSSDEPSFQGNNKKVGGA
jgi:hypothetical protein